MIQRKRTDMIIIHCTATPEGRDVRMETVRKWHKAQGWADVGYHYVIELDGTICAGRPLDAVGAHCAGRNHISVGVCYVGGLTADGKIAKDTRTEAQKRALQTVIASIRKRYGNIPVYGHCDFAAKACPSFDARKEYNH